MDYGITIKHRFEIFYFSIATFGARGGFHLRGGCFFFFVRLQSQFFSWAGPNPTGLIQLRTHLVGRPIGSVGRAPRLP